MDGARALETRMSIPESDQRRRLHQRHAEEAWNPGMTDALTGPRVLNTLQWTILKDIVKGVTKATDIEIERT